MVMGKPDGFVILTANRHGLLSLARSFLIAALSPPAESNFAGRPTLIEESLTQVSDSNDDLVLGWVEHAEVVLLSENIIAERKRRAWRNDRVALLGCSIVAFIFFFLTASGVLLWIGILTGNARWMH